MAFVVGALCVNYWVYAVVGAAVALLPLVVLAVTSSLGSAAWIPFLVGLVPALVFVVAATAVGVVRDVMIELPRNGYGLCSGSSDGQPDEAGVLPLTDWLHGFFQSVANRELAEPPVTFGDLWGTRDERAERDIELVLMTTNITRGISQRLPFLEGSWGQLFFKGQSPLDSLSRHHGRIRGSRAPLPQGVAGRGQTEAVARLRRPAGPGEQGCAHELSVAAPPISRNLLPRRRAFVEFVSTWTDNQTFDRGEDSSQGRSPRPKPALRMMPLGSNDPRAERPD
jgi:hypothetical protein